jgi:hypothetical protein
MLEDADAQIFKAIFCMSTTVCFILFRKISSECKLCLPRCPYDIYKKPFSAYVFV